MALHACVLHSAAIFKSHDKPMDLLLARSVEVSWFALDLCLWSATTPGLVTKLALAGLDAVAHATGHNAVVDCCIASITQHVNVSTVSCHAYRPDTCCSLSLEPNQKNSALHLHCTGAGS